jgi:transcriptional regulator with XRE-family HTH domain
MAAGDRRTSGNYLRVDTRALHAALEAARASRGLTWQQVAREVSATLPVSGAMLTRLSRGGRVTIDVALALAGWLGRTVESLTRPSKT